MKLSQDLISGAKGAADFSGLTPNIIYKRVAAGDLPVIRKGRKLYFRKSELKRAFSSEAAA